MKTEIIKSTAILFLGLLMATAVNAQSPRQGGRGNGFYRPGDGREMQRMRLDLSDEQQEQLTALRTEHYKAVTPLRNKMAELKARERTLLSEENVDMEAVNKNIDEQTAVENSLKKLQAEHQVAVKKVLTDEQIMQLQQRRHFANRDGYNRYGNRRGPGTGRGYRGI
jgi:Spy/CpxP family protein refolding chaperone